VVAHRVAAGGRPDGQSMGAQEDCRHGGEAKRKAHVLLECKSEEFNVIKWLASPYIAYKKHVVPLMDSFKFYMFLSYRNHRTIKRDPQKVVIVAISSKIFLYSKSFMKLMFGLFCAQLVLYISSAREFPKKCQVGQPSGAS
jgi:hypothetical protein